MNTYKILIEKSNYLHQSSWEELFVITEHWQSDILYFKDELRFLHLVIDRYLPELSKYKSIKTLKPLDKHFIHLIKTTDELTQSVEKHRKHIEELIENPFAYDDNKFKKEHENLENKFMTFIIEFQEDKNQVFKLTKKIMKYNK